MLFIYRVLIILTAPLALLWLRWKIPGPARLRARWRERLGSVPKTEGGVLWIHAASVGEVNAIAPLAEALLHSWPRRQLVISTMTVTGRAEAVRRFKDRAILVFAPLDTPVAVSRWLKRIRPQLAMVAETEIWPELYIGCQKRAIPLVLVNARMTEKALSGYLRFRPLFARALAAVQLAVCQSDSDADRFVRLGVDGDKCSVAGNLKFDLSVPDNVGQQARAWRRQWGERPAWVAGSTRPGEEEILLAAHTQLCRQKPDALLVLAPRHPERCGQVKSLIEQAGLAWQTLGEDMDAATSVVLVDRIGVLMPCYAAASAAFVGGSLVDIGGHNLLEPAALGKAVIAGPFLHQQEEAAHALRAGGALVTVKTPQDVADAVLSLWTDPEHALVLGRSALSVVAKGRGNLRRTLGLLRPFVEKLGDQPD